MRARIEWGVLLLTLAGELGMLPGPWAVVALPLVVAGWWLLRGGMMMRWCSDT